MEELKLYWMLSTCSQRALRRTKKQWGNPVFYNPQRRLCLRLAYETGMTEDQVREQLKRERKILTGQSW